jgi:hypothetical protein
MLKSSSLCSYSSNLGIFWLKIEQFWQFEENSIFSNGCRFWPIMQIRKKGGWNLKKIFSDETTEPISTKLCWNDPWVVPFQNCVHLCRPVSKVGSAVGAILIEGPNCRTHFWKRTIQWLFHQNFVLIEQMVSDKKIFMSISHRVLC